jgi:hypothetical protein
VKRVYCIFTFGDDPLDIDILKPAGAAIALLPMRPIFTKMFQNEKKEEEVLVSARVSIYLPPSMFIKGRHFDAILHDHERLLLFR